jgi:hypothetical protein
LAKTNTSALSAISSTAANALANNSLRVTAKVARKRTRNVTKKSRTPLSVVPELSAENSSPSEV